MVAVLNFEVIAREPSQQALNAGAIAKMSVLQGKHVCVCPKRTGGRHLFLSEHCASNLPPRKANREWLLASLANIGITFDMAKISGIGQ
jgi:hypothetical protein